MNRDILLFERLPAGFSLVAYVLMFVSLVPASCFVFDTAVRLSAIVLCFVWLFPILLFEL